MTDAAIAEHIVYLVHEYDKGIETQDKLELQNAQMKALALSAGIEINPEDYRVNPLKNTASDLLNRIQATLENRN